MGKGMRNEGWMEGALRNLKSRFAGPVQRSHHEGVQRVRTRFNRLLSKSARERKLKRKSGIAKGRIENEGTGGQCSYFFGPKHKSYMDKRTLSLLAPQIIISQNASQLLSAVAKQNISSPLSLCAPSLATNNTADKVSNTYFVTSTGDVTLNNIYLSNAYVIIYDVMARKDVPGTLGAPHSTWIQGDVDTSTGTNAYQVLGSTPWQTEAFNQYYEVKQVTNVVLCAGGTHVHKVRLRPNRSINSAYSTYTTTGLKGVSYWCMIEVHGSPANDVTTQTSVSIGVGGLNIITDKEETVKLLQKVTPIIQFTNSLGTFAVGEQVLNLGGSTIVPQAEG